MNEIQWVSICKELALVLYLPSENVESYPILENTCSFLLRNMKDILNIRHFLWFFCVRGIILGLQTHHFWKYYMVFLIFWLHCPFLFLFLFLLFFIFLSFWVLWHRMSGCLFFSWIFLHIFGLLGVSQYYYIRSPEAIHSHLLQSLRKLNSQLSIN